VVQITKVQLAYGGERHTVGISHLSLEQLCSIVDDPYPSLLRKCNLDRRILQHIPVSRTNQSCQDFSVGIALWSLYYAMLSHWFYLLLRDMVSTYRVFKYWILESSWYHFKYYKYSSTVAIYADYLYNSSSTSCSMQNRLAQLWPFQVDEPRYYGTNWMCTFDKIFQDSLCSGELPVNH